MGPGARPRSIRPLVPHHPMKLSSLRRLLPAAVLTLALAACVDDPTGPSARDGGASANGASATAWNGNIRIGVVPNASAVTIASQADWTLTDRNAGATLLSGTGGVTATVTLESGSVTETRYRLQVMCGSDAAVAARVAAAEAAGHPTFLEPVPASNCTRLYLGSFASNASFTDRNNYKNLLVSQGLAAADAFWRLVTVVSGVTQYRVNTGAQEVVSTGPVVLSSSDGLVTIGGARYRGVAEVRINGSGTLAGINDLPMEQYLYGVVPRELGPAQYPELEAQKAQAVAARTYALRGMGKRSSDGYDLLATTTDQVYGGYAAEHPLSTQAVDATAGLAATYNGQLIEALFYSTSGGFTANNEDVFSSAAIPYLRGVWDRPTGRRTIVLDSLPLRLPEVLLRTPAPADYEAGWSQYHRWKFEWTMDQMSEVISAYAGQPVGKVLAINVLERASSLRVTRIEYVTEAGTFQDTRDHIRTSLKYINASGTPANLLSTLFIIEPIVNRRTREVTGYRAFGGGWGHGVGLNQTGAVGMAERGATFDEIIRFYYQGVSLTQWY
jgi:stage II sporulation protein D